VEAVAARAASAGDVIAAAGVTVGANGAGDPDGSGGTGDAGIETEGLAATNPTFATDGHLVPRISIHNRRQSDKNQPGVVQGKVARMDVSNDEVMKELTRLRTEIQQLREIVNALFNAVFEESEEQWESAPERDEFNLYN
jgi:hypothetical protein